MKFGFVAKHRGIWPVWWLCAALGVSRSGFHAWLTRSPSARARSDEVLGAQLKASFVGSDRTYGARRVWHDVLAEGAACGLHRIKRLMREQALRAWPRRRGLPSDKGARHEAADNVLDRQFEATAPNQKWVADFTYIWTAQGWLYAAAVNVCDNAAMESFFSLLKTERTARKVYRTRDHARADVFDYIERFYNMRRRHSTIGYLSPMEFERIKASA